MYFECLWIGTPFQKQEHLKCAEKLIYNPRKHRCDNIDEFEIQFANGVQTGEELLEFMRFRNCISNIMSSSSTSIDSHNDNMKILENVAPPHVGYYPQGAAHLKNNDIQDETPTTESAENNNSLYILMNDDLTVRPREKTSSTSPTNTTATTTTTTHSSTNSGTTLKQKLASIYTPKVIELSNKVVNTTKQTTLAVVTTTKNATTTHVSTQTSVMKTKINSKISMHLH